MCKLNNKVALITGGNAGIGRAIALAFAKEGAKVVISGRNEQRIKDVIKELEEIGAECLGIKCDVSSSSEVKGMFSQALDKFGTLDILVNNAGIFRSDANGLQDRLKHLDMVTKPIPKYSLHVTRNMSDEEWQKMFDINVNGVFYCTREALKTMEDKGYGKIINIASMAGISAVSSHSPNYSASKGAVVTFTKAVAHEVAGAGVYVNGIAPGYMDSDTFMSGIEKMEEDQVNRLLQLIPAGKIGSVWDCAALAVYLASDDSNYMIGQIISPNGGIVI